MFGRGLRQAHIPVGVLMAASAAPGGDNAAGDGAVAGLGPGAVLWTSAWLTWDLSKWTRGAFADPAGRFSSMFGVLFLEVFFLASHHLAEGVSAVRKKRG